MTFLSKLKSKYIAAPLAGYSDQAWRLLISKMGAGAVYSEMVAVEGLIRGQKKTLKYLDNPEGARPFGIQLFGVEPESFRKTIEVISDYKFDMLDINMGCPVKKVVRKGAGAALMKDPKNIQAIIKAVRSEYKGFLTIKIRSGWNSENINAIEIARIAEGEGVDAITIHPRTGVQVFRGDADWSIIKSVKDVVKIPVIGNGDVTSVESAERMFKETGCDLIMIGRAAIGNPWIFRELAGGNPATLEEKYTLAAEHLKLLQKFYHEYYATRQIRKFIAKYIKGQRGYKEFLQKMFQMKTVEEILDSLKVFQRSQDEAN